MTKKRWFVITTIVAAVIIAAISVLINIRPRTSPCILPEGVQAGQISMEPYIYKVKTGMLSSIEYKAERGTLAVPENRSDPDSRLIALPVIRVHSLSDDPAEPVFWLAGGPGQSNMKFFRLKGLIDNHDIVMVGYRGVDGSSVLDSPEMAKDIKGAGDNLFSEQSITKLGDAMTRTAVRLQEEGVDLDGYTIPETINDIEAARIGLGYEHINLLSASYGTRVAMIYAWMHPDSLHRSAMIAVNPPGHMVWEPEVVDQQIEYYADLGRQDSNLSGRTPDLAETVRNVAHNMPTHWLFLPIDPGKVKFMTHFMLFNRGMASSVFDIYITAEQGDPSGLALMCLMYDFMIPGSMTWGQWTAMGATDYSKKRDYITEMDPPGSILGAPTSLLVGGSLQRSAWPEPPFPTEFREVQPSEVETLLVSGSVDFSCPPQFATDELLPSLSEGKQVILSEFGHTDDLWELQPEATVRLLSSFYDTGMADDSLYTYQSMDFHVGLGFPEIAKIALAVIILVIIGLLALVWFIVRTVRRRKTQQTVR